MPALKYLTKSHYIMQSITLYSTLGCHLCEEAKKLLDVAQQTYDFDYAVVEIADDDNLLEQYGLRIPVLKCSSLDVELGWPFDLSGLAAWFGLA